MSLTHKAFDAIREAIVSGGVEFGERLSEVQIAKALGMSKAPVRAAFIELRDMGLVNVVPQAGTYVFTPSSEDVHNMSSFRAILEREALRRAVETNPARVSRGLGDAIAEMRRAIEMEDWAKYRRADSAFHSVFFNESGNPYLNRANNLTAMTLEALRVRLQKGEGDYRRRSFDEHCRIMEALDRQDISAATDILMDHIMVISRSLPGLPDFAERRDSPDKRSDTGLAELFSKKIQK